MYEFCVYVSYVWKLHVYPMNFNLMKGCGMYFTVVHIKVIGNTYSTKGITRIYIMEFFSIKLNTKLKSSKRAILIKYGVYLSPHI